MKRALLALASFAVIGSGCSIGDSGTRDKQALRAVAGMQRFFPKRPTEMHTWEFTVTKDGQVSSSRNYGDPPPQYGVPSS